MPLFQEVTPVPQEYTAFNPEYAKDFPAPDSLENRQQLVDGIEQKLRDTYGESALAEPSQQMLRSLKKRKDDLAYALSKTYHPEATREDLRHRVESEELMPALTARERFVSIANTLGEMPTHEGENTSKFIMESEDGSLRSPAETAEGDAITAVLTYIHEHAPEVIELVRETHPFTNDDAANDPDRRLFYEQAVNLFALKPPEDVQSAFPNLRLWRNVFEQGRQSMLFFLSNEVLKTKYRALFQKWEEHRSS